MRPEAPSFNVVLPHSRFLDTAIHHSRCVYGGGVPPYCLRSPLTEHTMHSPWCPPPLAAPSITEGWSYFIINLVRSRCKVRAPKTPEFIPFGGCGHKSSILNLVKTALDPICANLQPWRLTVFRERHLLWGCRGRMRCIGMLIHRPTHQHKPTDGSPLTAHTHYNYQKRSVTWQTTPATQFPITINTFSKHLSSLTLFWAVKKNDFGSYHPIRWLPVPACTLLQFLT